MMRVQKKDLGQFGETELARAYAAAHYFVTIGHREWLFGVGQLAEDIERQLGATSYLFITAWNPAPHAASVDENMAADQRLQLRLRESGYSHYSALGSNAQGGAVEYGWIVLWALLSRFQRDQQFWHDAWAGTRLIDVQPDLARRRQ